MSSRFPGRGYSVRRVTVRRVAEAQMSLGDAGPEATAMTVSQLVERMNGILKGGIPDVWVKGEIVDMRRPGSGHLYFSLKDERAAMPCVMWRSTAVRLPFEAEEGLLVLARGYPDVYAPSGKLSLVVSELQPVRHRRPPARVRAAQSAARGRGALRPRKEETAPAPPAAHRRRDVTARRGSPRHPQGTRRALPECARDAVPGDACRVPRPRERSSAPCARSRA